MPNDYMPFKTIMAAASRFMKKDHTEAPGTSGNLNGNTVKLVHNNNAPGYVDVVNEYRSKITPREPNATSVNLEFKKEEISKSPSGYTGIGQAVYDFFAAIGNVPAHIARFGNSLLHRSSNSKENHSKAHPAGLHDNNRPASITKENPKTKTNHGELSAYVTSTLGGGKNTFLRGNYDADSTTRAQINLFFKEEIIEFMDDTKLKLPKNANSTDNDVIKKWFTTHMLEYFFKYPNIAAKVDSMSQELCNDFAVIRNAINTSVKDPHEKSELMKHAAANYLLTRGVGPAIGDYIAGKALAKVEITKDEYDIAKLSTSNGSDERLLEIFNKIADRGVVAA